MSYSNGQFTARPMGMVTAAASFGTATASSATGANKTAVTLLPGFIRATKVTAVRLLVTTAPDDGSTALVAQFLNGTNTFATVTLTTATAGQVLSGTVTASNGTFTAGAQPTVNVTGTATASADLLGSYSVFFEETELYS